MEMERAASYLGRSVKTTAGIRGPGIYRSPAPKMARGGLDERVGLVAIPRYRRQFALSTRVGNSNTNWPPALLPAQRAHGINRRRPNGRQRRSRHRQQ